MVPCKGNILVVYKIGSSTSGVAIGVFNGLTTLEDCLDVRAKLSELCHREGLSKVLLDFHSADVDMSIMDQFQFGHSFPEAKFPLYVKIVVLVNPQFHETHGQMLMVTVGQNRYTNISTTSNLKGVEHLFGPVETILSELRCVSEVQ